MAKIRKVSWSAADSVPMPGDPARLAAWATETFGKTLDNALCVSRQNGWRTIDTMHITVEVRGTSTKPKEAK